VFLIRQAATLRKENFHGSLAFCARKRAGEVFFAAAQAFRAALSGGAAVMDFFRKKK
jgi:hypothetical protein